MTDQNFNYIIQTVLELAPGSLERLLHDISKLDNQIKASKEAGLTINAKLNPNSKRWIQEQVQRLPATMTVKVKLDERSMLDVKARVEALTKQIENVTVNANGGKNDQGLRKVMNRKDREELSAMLSLERESAITEDLLARAALRRASAEEKSAKAITLKNKAQLQEKQLQEALLKLEEREAKLKLTNAKINESLTNLALKEVQSKYKLQQIAINNKMLENGQLPSRVGRGSGTGRGAGIRAADSYMATMDMEKQLQQAKKDKEALEIELKRVQGALASGAYGYSAGGKYVDNRDQERILSAKVEAMSKVITDADAQIQQIRKESMDRIYSSAKMHDASPLPPNSPITQAGKAQQALNREQERARKQQQAQLEKEAVNLQAQLLNPKVDINSKRNDIVPKWFQMQQQLSQTMGKSHFASYQIADKDPITGLETKARSATYEFTKLGQVLDKADKSFNSMASHMAKNVLYYGAITSAIYGLTTGLQNAVQVMAQFQSEFISLNQFAAARNSENGLTGDKAFSQQKTQDTIFGLAKDYGYNAANDVLPVYSKVIRKEDLGKDPQVASMLTEQILQMNRIASGQGASGEDIGKMTDDYASVYTKLRPEWMDQKKSPAREMRRLLDEAAVFSNTGAPMDRTFDAFADLASFSVGKDAIPPGLLMAISAQQLEKSNDSTGPQISSLMRVVLTNLSRTNGQSTNIRRELGFGTDPKLPNILDARVDDVVKVLYEKIKGGSESEVGGILDKLTDGQINTIAMQTASNSGSGGLRYAEIQTMLRDVIVGAVDKYDEISKSGDTDGAAKRKADEYSTSITGEFNKLISSAQELAVDLGNAGLTSVITTLIKWTRSAVETVDYFASGMARFSQGMHLFGNEITQSIVTVMSLGAAIKGSIALYQKLNSAQAIKTTAEGILENVPQIGHNGKPLTTTSVSKPGKFGEVFNDALGIAGLVSMFKGGSGWFKNNGGFKGLVTKGTAEAPTVLSKIIELFKGLAPWLARFLGLITRFSLIGIAAGAAIGGAWMIGKAMYDNNQKQATSNAGLFQQTVNDPKKLASLRDGLNTVAMYNNSLFGNTHEPGHLSNNDKFLLNAGNTLKSFFTGKPPEKVYKADPKEKNGLDIASDTLKFGPELKKIMKEKVAPYGVSGTGYGPEGLKITLVDDNGKTFEKTFDPAIMKSYSEINDLIEAAKQKQGILAYNYNKNNKPLFDQKQMLSDINDLLIEIGKRSEYMQNASAYNDFKFMGATDSSSYYQAQMGTISESLGGVAPEFDRIKNQRDTITAQQLKDDQLVGKYGKEISSTQKSSIDQALQTSIESNTLDHFLDAYDKKDASKEDEKLFNYAQSARDKAWADQGIKNLDEAHKQFLQTVTESITKYKELYTQYLVSASGVQIYEAALRGLNSSVAHSQSIFNLAAPSADNAAKIQASVGLIGNLAKVTRVYHEELASVQSNMNDIQTKHPGQDFSTNGLYNPGPEGLTGEQSAFKQQYEKSLELNANKDQSVEVLRNQVDAMTDLVLTSSKYKEYWDSITERITLSNNLAKQLRDIQTGGVVSDTMVGVRQKLFGDSFDSGDFRKQAAAQRRDSYLGAYEQIQKAKVTYADDSSKLNEAISSITGSIDDKIKSALLDPLNTIISGDFQSAADKDLEAANTFSNAVRLWEGVLNDQKAAFKNFADQSGVVSSYQTPDFTEEQKKQISEQFFSNPDNWPKGSTDIESAKENLKHYGFHENQNEMYKSMQNVLFGNSDAGQRLNGMLDGKLTGQGSTFLSVGKKYGIDPNLMAAIAIHETANGKSDVLKNNNNVGGLGWNGSSYFKFDSVESSIDYLGKLLSNFYIGKGKDSISKINDKYAEDDNWKNRVADYYSQLTGVKNPLNVKFSVGEITSAVMAGVDQKSTDNKDAEANISSKESEILLKALQAQVEYVSANNVNYNYQRSLRDTGLKAQLSGLPADAIMGMYDTKVQSIIEATNAKIESENTKASYIDQRNSATDPQTKKVYQDMIDALDRNADSLDQLIAEYSAGLYNNPTYNGTEASRLRSESMGRLNEMKSSGQDNTPQWLKEVANYNQLSQLMSLEKAVGMNQQMFDFSGQNYSALGQGKINLSAQDNELDVQKKSQITEFLHTLKEGTDAWATILKDLVDIEKKAIDKQKSQLELAKQHFDLTGKDYGGYLRLKGDDWQKNVNLIFTQLNSVTQVLATIKEGTNKWHLAAEDYVEAQQKILDIENKKTETAKRYFELSGKGLGAYVNDQAYQTSRDQVRNIGNLKTSKDYYSENMGKGNMDYNSQFVALKIIGDTHNNIINTLHEYKQAMVDAYRAGGMSLDDYMQRLHDLRDVQDETKQQAVSMVESMQNTFQSSFAGSLKSAMQGNLFDAQLDFGSSIKAGLADTISNQMSNVLVQNSGLNSIMNNMISAMTQSMTSGDPNQDLNAFNFGNFGDQINSVIAKFQPYIKAIADSTQGMFGIMKDENFNVPSGYKIDSVLYELEKAKTTEDIGSWFDPSGTRRNEAGSPFQEGSSGTISVDPLPLPKNPFDYVTPAIDPVKQTADGYALPMVNPMKMAIKDIMAAQGKFDMTNSVNGTAANKNLHIGADEARTIITQLDQKFGTHFLEKIGTGLSPDSMGITELQNLLKDSSLDQFDMVEGIDGVGNGVDEMINKLDQIKVAIEAINQSASGGTSYNGGTTGIGGSQTPILVGNQIPTSSGSGSGSGSVGTVLTGNQIPTAPKQSTAAPKSNQQLFLENLVSAGGGNGEWAKNELANHRYHTGGIAGVMNFASGMSLKPDEISAVLRKGEPIFTGAQIGGLVDRMFGSGSSGGGSSSDSTLNVNVNVNGGGNVNEDVLMATVSEAVNQSMREFGRQMRLGNLQTKGVAY